MRELAWRGLRMLAVAVYAAAIVAVVRLGTGDALVAGSVLFGGAGLALALLAAAHVVECGCCWGRGE